MPNRAALAAGIAMLLAAALIPVVEPHHWLARELPPLRLEVAIPSEFGDWHIDRSIAPVLPSPDVQAQVSQVYSQVLSRTYVDAAGDRIMLVIAYGEDQLGKTSVAHLPDACYPAQGFAVSPRPNQPVMISTTALNVQRLVARKAARNEPITYWAAVGNVTFASDYERRITRYRSALTGVIPDGMLVRVSSIDNDESRAFSLQNHFISNLFESLESNVRPRLFGNNSS
jgi:EpsI family protein